MYDNPNSCNRCGGENIVNQTDSIEYTMCEAETECKDCGFKDYWAYGHFESGAEIVSKCKKYSLQK